MKISMKILSALYIFAIACFVPNSFAQEVIPITATLPIKAVGNSCSELTLGTTAYPNLIASEGIAITADRTSLLTCQSGQWKKSSGVSGGNCGTSGVFGGSPRYRFVKCEGATLSPGSYCHGYVEGDMLFSGFIDATATKLVGLARDNGDNGLYFGLELNMFTWSPC